MKDDAIRYAVCESSDSFDHLDALDAELRFLIESTFETTLLVFPHATNDFDHFNDWLGEANGLLRDRRLWGVIQLVGFHPQFRFAESEPDDAANFTNRSPYPMLHLLRESSIEAVRKSDTAVAAIPERNRSFLQTMGQAKIEAALIALKAGREVGQ